MKSKSIRALALCVLAVASSQMAFGADKLDILSGPYKTLRYNNINGFVYSDGTVKKATTAGLVKYNAIGCSGYVVPILNKYIYGANWKVHQKANWRLYQQYGSTIASAFHLPLKATLSSFEIDSPASIQSRISSGALKKGGKYFFDTRFGAAGHVGFIQVNADGTLDSYMFSGIGKGTDFADKTYNPAKFPALVAAHRTARVGYRHASFAAWFKGSQYKNSSVKLYELPTGYSVSINYSWPSGQKDLDTGTTFLGTTVGYSYPDNTLADYMTWSLDNTQDGPEFVRINLDKAIEDEILDPDSPVTIDLAAGWYSPAGGSGPATVTATLYRNNTVIQTETTTISPGTQSGQASTSVGQVTIDLSAGALSLTGP